MCWYPTECSSNASQIIYMFTNYNKYNWLHDHHEKVDIFQELWFDCLPNIGFRH